MADVADSYKSLDNMAFTDGIKRGSYLAGLATALRLAELDSVDVANILINILICDTNLELAGCNSGSENKSQIDI